MAREHARALLALFAIGALYVAGLVAMPPEGLTHHDTGAKYLQVRNLRLAPSGLDWSINYPARSLDPQLEFVPFHPRQHTVDERGRIHLQWPIFLGLLTRIPWKVIGFWGLYVVPLLAGLGSLWAAYRLALAVGVPRKVAWLAVPLAGLATPVFIYSLLYFEHTLATMLVTLSLLAMALSMRGKAHDVRSVAVSGALLAAAIYFRSELYVLAVVMAAALALMAWRRGADEGGGRRRPLLVWAGAFLVALVPLWVFYAITTGSVLPLHATYYFAAGDGASAGGASGLDLPPLRYIAQAGWGVVPDSLLGPQGFPLSPPFSPWEVLAGLAGVGLCALAALGGLLRIRLSWRVGLLAVGLALIAVATLPTLISGQGYYNLHGLLLASPFVVLALWPPGAPGDAVEPEIMGSRWLYAVTLAYVVMHTLVISAFSGLGPISRNEWGQRYILPAYPALVVLALLAGWRLWEAEGRKSKVESRKSKVGNGDMQYAERNTPLLASVVRRPSFVVLAIWVVLVLIGVGFNVRGYVMLRDQREQVVAWQGLARSLPQREPLVTDVWWLPLNLAADFYTRPMMLAEGDERLVQWAAQMRERGVRGFGLMTEEPAVFRSEWVGRVKGLRADGAPREARGMWLQRYVLGP